MATISNRLRAWSPASLATLARRLIPVAAVIALVLAMNGTWMTSRTANAAPAAQGPPASEAPPRRAGKRHLTGKLNLNTATEDQLMMLPTVGPAKAERIVTWRKKNGGFKRTADLRRVKGFGYKTYKKLEPLLDIKGETTLAAR